MTSSLFKTWSSQYTRSFVLGILFFFVILIMALFTLEAGLTCVDEYGCLRSACNLSDLRTEYQTIIRKSMSNNAKCVTVNS